MCQQLQSWQLRGSEKLWLSMLIDAIEEVSCSEFRTLSCDSSTLAALGTQLARPTSPYLYGTSSFSLRN